MNRTILVVDDIAANRNLLGETLEPKGYEVLLASNGAMALKVAERARAIRWRAHSAALRGNFAVIAFA